MPTAAPGFSVKAFASGLDHPRWLYVLPDGDVLVAETNARPSPTTARASPASSWRLHEEGRRRSTPAPTRWSCCAIPIMTAWPMPVSISPKASIRPSA
ncbi:MAG: hypothetical protein WDN06_23005 [Asticcacaulis sp.]